MSTKFSENIETFPLPNSRLSSATDMASYTLTKRNSVESGYQAYTAHSLSLTLKEFIPFSPCSLK